MTKEELLNELKTIEASFEHGLETVKEKLFSWITKIQRKQAEVSEVPAPAQEKTSTEPKAEVQ